MFDLTVNSVANLISSLWSKLSTRSSQMPGSVMDMLIVMGEKMR